MNRMFRLVVVAVSLLLLVVGPVLTTAQEAVTLELWTFVNTHARWFREQAERYKEEVNPNFQLEVVEIASGELFDRLRISLQSSGVGAPDIADIEQGAFGSFLRGGGDPGLIDLTAWLEEGGHNEKLVSARQALYTYNGKTYGIEHALTPVVLYYRADIWEAAGHDPQTFETWDDFVAAAIDVTEQNPGTVALPVYRALHELLLRQRGGDLFDEDGNITLDSELSIDTMNWLLEQIDAGIARQQPSGDVNWAAFKDGTQIAHIGADWYAGFFKDNAPELAGMWKAAPLPAWEEGGSRTSVFGGTGATIIATSPHVEVAWDFLQFAMLSEEGNVRRFELTNLFPPFYPAMENERLLFEDEYFSDQVLGEVFASVAPGTPPQYQSPYRTQMNALLDAAFQDILDGNRTPEEVFREVADTIRDDIEFES
jgi:arabinosaccharide transport system substrate-binding protein